MHIRLLFANMYNFISQNHSSLLLLSLNKLSFAELSLEFAGPGAKSILLQIDNFKIYSNKTINY